jgi:hypothetical protein
MSSYDIISNKKKLVVSIHLGLPLERPNETILVYRIFQYNFSNTQEYKFIKLKLKLLLSRLLMLFSRWWGSSFRILGCVTV